MVPSPLGSHGRPRGAVPSLLLPSGLGSPVPWGPLPALDPGGPWWPLLHLLAALGDTGRSCSAEGGRTGLGAEVIARGEGGAAEPSSQPSLGLDPPELPEAIWAVPSAHPLLETATPAQGVPREVATAQTNVQSTLASGSQGAPGGWWSHPRPLRLRAWPRWHSALSCPSVSHFNSSTGNFQGGDTSRRVGEVRSPEAASSSRSRGQGLRVGSRLPAFAPRLRRPAPRMLWRQRASPLGCPCAHERPTVHEPTDLLSESPGRPGPQAPLCSPRAGPHAVAPSPCFRGLWVVGTQSSTGLVGRGPTRELREEKAPRRGGRGHLGPVPEGKASRTAGAGTRPAARSRVAGGGGELQGGGGSSPLASSGLGLPARPAPEALGFPHGRGGSRPSQDAFLGVAAVGCLAPGLTQCPVSVPEAIASLWPRGGLEVGEGGRPGLTHHLLRLLPSCRASPPERAACGPFGICPLANETPWLCFPRSGACAGRHTQAERGRDWGSRPPAALPQGQAAWRGAGGAGPGHPCSSPSPFPAWPRGWGAGESGVDQAHMPAGTGQRPL